MNESFGMCMYDCDLSTENLKKKGNLSDLECDVSKCLVIFTCCCVTGTHLSEL